LTMLTSGLEGLIRYSLMVSFTHDRKLLFLLLCLNAGLTDGIMLKPIFVSLTGEFSGFFAAAEAPGLMVPFPYEFIRH